MKVTIFNRVELCRKPFVSVVMPIYNSQRYLPEAIESILTQTYPNLELLLIDDGSADGSLDIAASYERDDKRVRLLRRVHAGLIATLNAGCDQARGKFIARLDSDDIALPERLEKQLNFLQSAPNVALLGGGFECVDESGEGLFTVSWPSCHQGLTDFMLMDCHIAHTTTMFRRDVFVELGGYRAMYPDAEDYDLFLRMGDRYLIDNLPDVICKYRLHDGQISERKVLQQILSGIGARLSTRERRAHRQEPNWKGSVVTKEGLNSLGVTEEWIHRLYTRCAFASARREVGWRWADSPFCKLYPR